MRIITKDILIAENSLTLTNQRAFFWEAEKTLVLSDLHIGKTAHFRKAGIAIPAAVLENDLKRLDLLIYFFDTRTILIVGDLFHAENNTDIDRFKIWRETYAHKHFELIKGNHDRFKDAFYAEMDISIFKTHKDVGALRFVHDETHCQDDKFCVSGHTHPGIVLKGRGKVRLKLPCFEVSEKRLILPAFSEFTGLNTTKSVPSAVFFAFTDNSIFEV